MPKTIIPADCLPPSDSNPLCITSEYSQNPEDTCLSLYGPYRRPFYSEDPVVPVKSIFPDVRTIAGPKGDDGATPYIGENRHWFLAGLDTGVDAAGIPGGKGNTGAAATIQIGAVTEGLIPKVTNSGDEHNAILNFELVAGPKGEKGNAFTYTDFTPEQLAGLSVVPDISVGTVLTGDPDAEALVSITGPTTAPVLNFLIPKGVQGNPGVYVGSDVPPVGTTVQVNPNATVASFNGVPDCTNQTGKLLLNDGVNSSWGNTIAINAADQVGLIVKGVSGQSANLQEWRDNAGSILGRIGSDGVTYFANTIKTPYGIVNSSSSTNASISTASNGTIISRNVADANPALIVNQVNAASTGNIAVFQYGGAAKATITRDGALGLNSWVYTAYGIQNSTTPDNAYVSTPATGTLIKRNVADANPALIVDQANTGSTGNILLLKAAGTTKCAVNYDGSVYTPYVCNLNSSDNAMVTLSSNGVRVTRNIADANAALIVNQVHASSTGKIQEWQFGSTIKASVDKDGNAYFANVYTNWIVNSISSTYSLINTGSNGTVISRNIADANSALIVNQVNASSTGNIQEWQFGGTQKAYVTKSGDIFAPHFIAAGGLQSSSGSDKSYINTTVAGTIITRTVADANTALIVDQANAGSTGYIQVWKFGGAQKAAFDKDGVLTASGYKSSDGSAGVSGTFTSQDGKTITVKNGLITAIV